MSQADPLSTPACPAAEAARGLGALLAMLHAAEDPPVGVPDPAIAAGVGDLLDGAIVRASWTRALSVDGALMHLALGAALAADMARAAPAQADALERRMMRHLHAVRAFLLAHGGDGAAPVLDYAMPAREDRTVEITSLTGGLS